MGTAVGQMAHLISATVKAFASCLCDLAVCLWLSAFTPFLQHTTGVNNISTVTHCSVTHCTVTHSAVTHSGVRTQQQCIN